MVKLIGLEFRKNSKYLLSIFTLQLLACIILGLLEYTRGLRQFFDDPKLVTGLFSAVTMIFVIISLIYIFLSQYRDFFKNSGLLTYSLPVSELQLKVSKLLSLVLVYLINSLFLFGFLKIAAYKIDSNIIYFFALVLVWLIIIQSLIALAMQFSRFKQTNFPILTVFGILLAIIGVGFVFNKFSSFVLVNGGIQHAKPMNYAFIYPFAIGNHGLYKNITPIIYYMLVAVVLIGIESSKLKEGHDF